MLRATHVLVHCTGCLTTRIHLCHEDSVLPHASRVTATPLGLPRARGVEVQNDAGRQHSLLRLPHEPAGRTTKQSAAMTLPQVAKRCPRSTSSFCPSVLRTILAPESLTTTTHWFAHAIWETDYNLEAFAFRLPQADSLRAQRSSVSYQAYCKPMHLKIL